MLAALEDRLKREGGELQPAEELHFLPAKPSACINGGESLRLRKLIPQHYITTHGSLHPLPHVTIRNDTHYYRMQSKLTTRDRE